MVSRSKYSEVVQAGMELLDEKMPGWECQIDPEILDLASCRFCMLGQIYGDYGEGERILGLDDGFGHGFDALLSGRQEYAFLTRTWLRVIRKRLTSKLGKIAKRFK